MLSKRTQDDSSEDEFDDEQLEDDEDDSEPGKRTPSTDSAEDFEMLDKSVESLDKAKTTGASQKQGKAGKRKNKKR